jgi:Putative adhesin
VSIRRFIAVVPAALAAFATAAAAQRVERSTADWLADCRDRDWGSGEHACDVRETTIPARGAIRVDGGENGGITVTGWDRNEIKVVARMEAQARDERDAQDLLKRIEIRTSPDVRAEGPQTRSREGWSVSFDVYVPRHTNLDLETHNGGVKIADVDAQVRFDAVNGGVKLTGLAGDVRGQTENGGVSVTLDGDRWRGAGLDVRTQNGGVKLDVPTRYNADLETGTVNGHVDLDFPVTVSGRVGRTINTRLGGGGAPIRVRTTNGGVIIRQR